MNTITREQVQTLVTQLPEAELPVAHRLLTQLVEEPIEDESPQAQLMKLPLAERRKVLAQQAAEAVSCYEEMREEIDEWLAGDFVFMEE